MGQDELKLSLLELSAVREVANIGLGHATTALSELTGVSFEMDVPNVESVTLTSFPDRLGGPEQTAVGVYMAFVGDVHGHCAFIFPWASAQTLWLRLLGRAPEYPWAVDELAGSAMLEIGNILNSNYLNAIADMASLRLHATPPIVSVDSAYSIVSSIVSMAELDDVVALAVETRISRHGEESPNGYFLCVPTVEGLRALFQGIGVRGAA